MAGLKPAIVLSQQSEGAGEQVAESRRLGARAPDLKRGFGTKASVLSTPQRSDSRSKLAEGKVC